MTMTMAMTMTKHVDGDDDGDEHGDDGDDNVSCSLARKFIICNMHVLMQPKCKSLWLMQAREN